MRFARRIKKMEGDTELKDLMDLSAVTDVISFAGGFPSPETYPLDEIRESFNEVINNHGQEALSYSSAGGYYHLREIIADRMNKKYDLSFSAEEIIISSGSQQALDISGMLFLDEGDIVLFETPSYLGALNVFKSYEAELMAVQTDSDGIIIEELEKILEKYGEKIKLIYVNPDFQNPTCRCWSNERRKAFMNLISKYDIAILEDAAYSELAFDNVKRDPLISMDTKGQVIYCGSFSKTFCPGLRVAWIAACKNLIDKFLLLKTNVDLSSSSITQRQVAWYLDQFDFDIHIQGITSLYKARRDVMVEKMNEYFPKEVRYEVPYGGLFLWVELPEGKDSAELLKLALKEKVAFVPGGAFYVKHSKCNEFRLNFSNMPEDRIDKGIRTLGRILHNFIK